MRTQLRCKFDRFITTHFICPFVLFVLVFSALEFTRLDIRIGQLFYDSLNNEWPFRDLWLTKTLLHDWGQLWSIAMGVLVLSAFLLSRICWALRPYSKLLAFLCVASIAGPVLIAVIKNTTHIYCPWDLTLFGGDKPYIRLFDFAAYPLTVGHCFPAGHAGAGYAFISLYFFFLLVRPEYRYYGLAVGIGIGLIFGFTQQLRGAHFMSHDVFSLAICWFTSFFVFTVFFWRDVQWN